ncbi:MAG TPA: ABC transporter permease [Frankiaceae bacterium]|nr:ABC transporter permease [Frankiaceae bacterium]
MTEQATVSADTAVDRDRPWQHVWSGVSYRNIGAVYVWIVLIIIFTAWKYSLFWHVQTAKTVLNQYSITGLAALSIVVPLASGIFDLSIGSTMGLAGVGAGWLFQHTSWNPAFVFILVLLGSVVVGLFNSLVVVLLRIDSFIGTLATGAVLGAITLGVSGDQTFTARINGGFSRTASASWGGIQIPVLYMFVLLVVLGYFLEQTTSGRYCYASGYNAEVARLVGVRVGRLRTLSLVISATMAGFAGLILTAQIQAADPTNGPSYLIPAFSAAFLGATQFRHGRFNPWGVIVAVLMLGTGSVGLLLAGSPTWAPQIFQGAVLIAAVGVTVVQVRNRRSTA